MTLLTEQDVAKQMGDIAASMGGQFTLSVGDNFYDNGVTDVDEPRFKENFEVKKLGTSICRYLYEALHCTRNNEWNDPTLRCFMTRQIDTRSKFKYSNISSCVYSLPSYKHPFALILPIL